jgi:trehalose synthase
MDLVCLEQKEFADYIPYIDQGVLEEINYLAGELKGKRVAMINATSFGGGVAEKLYALIPLLKDLGLQVDWWVLEGSCEYFQVTKLFHNALQGQEGSLSDTEIEIYRRNSALNAAHMKNWDYDFIVCHDPQPAALIDLCNGLRQRARWIWRCHIDTSSPNPEYWDFLYRYIRQYDAAIFTMRDYVSAEAALPQLTLITPSIDPLSSKNRSDGAGRSGRNDPPLRGGAGPTAHRPGLALRSLEGSAGSDRGLQDGEEGVSQRTAGPGGLDGHR